MPTLKEPGTAVAERVDEITRLSLLKLFEWAGYSYRAALRDLQPGHTVTFTVFGDHDDEPIIQEHYPC